jgi:hypothetical protein
MHSWHIAFQGLFQSFETYPSKNIVSNAFFPNFRYKRILEGKYFKNELHFYGAILYFSYSKFSFENQIVGRE